MKNSKGHSKRVTEKTSMEVNKLQEKFLAFDTNNEAIIRQLEFNFKLNFVLSKHNESYRYTLAARRASVKREYKKGYEAVLTKVHCLGYII